jgi:hypothetical protein
MDARVQLAAVFAALAACTAVGTRPHLGPKPGAVVDTLGAGPGAVTTALASALRARGLKVHVMSAAEGYLETAWFDPVTKGSVPQRHLHTGRVFRIRAFADSIPPVKSELVIEAVYRRIADPSQPGREEEILVPPGQPGDSLAQQILAELRQRFGK